MPKNERKTEELVRDAFRAHGYYNPDNPVQVEEQKSALDSVKRAMKGASKTGKGGAGAPEFIVSDPTTPDFILITEAKADPRDHASPRVAELLAGTAEPVPDDETEAAEALKAANKHAADGALHYARHLSREHNVIALAASGETAKAFKVTAYLWPKGASRPKLLTNQDGHPIEEVLSWPDFIKHASFDEGVRNQRMADLMAFSRELHDFMRDHGKLSESEKPLLVSGTLIALQDPGFALAYSAYSPADLQRKWLEAIQDQVERADIPQAKKTTMTQPYSGIAVHPELGKATPAYPRGVLHRLVALLDEHVKPFISVYHDFDVVGQFYGEFLKYTGGDKKALGIVLTPRHVCELFALMADLTPESTVSDLCTGTGAFLISSMVNMAGKATTEAQVQRIKAHGLVGVEQQPQMFALAASNMILRGDGKANLYQGSCFDAAIVAAVKGHKPDVGMLNPPYAQGDASLHELRFIQQQLEVLVPGGRVFAIVPMSCATNPHPLRAQLMAHHTLEAVMSMPGELFYPVGVVTCVMVWRAHVPHATTNRKTWLGYWKDDGFIKTKHRGRVDAGEWATIRDRWVEMYREGEERPGESVKAKLGPDDEWLAEAYMETDYGTITPDDFRQALRDLTLHRMLTGLGMAEQPEPEEATA